MEYFTSDTHFQHQGKPVELGGSGGVIKLCKRPFANIAEHDAELIRRWNERVRPNDTVYHLGDFALGDQNNVPNIVAQLNGRIHLILGNHDNRRIVGNLDCFASIQAVSQIKVAGERIWLSHYAHRAWNKSHRGSYHFYGHSHGSMPPLGRSLDVGVDCWDYQPVTLAEIKQRLTDLGTIDAYMNHHPSRA